MIKNTEDRQASIGVIQDQLEPLLQEFDNFKKPIYNTHINLVNKFLQKFTTYIRIKEFTYLKNTSEVEQFRIFPVFEVYGEQVIFSAPSTNSKFGNARYSLSEGDKSTIALCFFLARVEYLGVKDKIIVFDDPLSSFDYSRRTATIYQLAKIANDAVQFIMLTHDLAFAADFIDKCDFLETTNLKIENDGATSRISWFDIFSEFLTPTQKDIQVIKNYLLKGENSESGKRDVIRCIRPVLEGMIKTKYFDLIPNNVWLGEIILMIRNSKPDNRLHKLNAIAEEIIELNDYTKNFHHASGDSRPIPIDNQELSRYIQLLMRIIDEV